MRLQTAVEGIRPEDHIFFRRKTLKLGRELAEYGLEMRRDGDTADGAGAWIQGANSFKERTGRVFPKRWANRPASTSSETS